MTGKKTVFMFSGQGSQYFQMGRALFESNAVFHDWMLKLDRMVVTRSGVSVIQKLYAEQQAPGAAFDRTIVTHPAIFMVEYSLAQSLMHAGVAPDVTLGVSVGSFAAATVAGLLDVNDAIAAVVEQASTLEQWCEPGGMIAVLGDPKLFAESFLAKSSALAAVNFESHFVVSARRQDIGAIEMGLKSRGIAYQRLPVSFAFHSEWIDNAAQPFESYLRSIKSKAARIPMMCCERVALLSDLPAGYFWQAARRPMRFSEAAGNLEERGSYRYVDVGPAGTLATFLKYVVPRTSRSECHAILTRSGRDLQNFAAVTGTRH
jgi:bacillaene synthase trans-acting acyltransferase